LLTDAVVQAARMRYDLIGPIMEIAPAYPFSFPSSLPDDLIFLTETEVSMIVKRKPQTMRIDRGKGIGIPFVRVGKRQIRYRLSDVKAYMTSRVCQSTSQILA